MTTWMKSMVLLGATAGLIGCGSSGPSDPRQPVGSLNEGDTGIQSKDVAAATDKMVNSLLSSPALNTSATKWTIVLDRGGFQNNTTDPTYSYDVFYTRLESRIFELSNGRVSLIQDKGTLHAEQNRQLEGAPDTMGQGGGGSGYPGGIQPQYDLTIRISQMANRETDYFVINAQATNLQTRQIAWISPAYEFKSVR